MTRQIISHRPINKAVIGSITVLFTILAGIWAVEDRYVNAEEMQQEVQQIHLRIDVEKKRTLDKEYYEFVKLVAQNPDSESLKEELEAIKEERKYLEEKIDQRIGNE
tara:strand:+ start:136 stop:456 length:321 start_codon:yes stop_codon:yes gene_type:complete